MQTGVNEFGAQFKVYKEDHSPPDMETPLTDEDYTTQETEEQYTLEVQRELSSIYDSHATEDDDDDVAEPATQWIEAWETRHPGYKVVSG